MACGTKRTLRLTTAGDKCCVMRPDFRCSFFDRFMFIEQILQVLWILPLSQETGEGFPPHDITAASYAELCCQLSSFVSGIISNLPLAKRNDLKYVYLTWSHWSIDMSWWYVKADRGNQSRHGATHKLPLLLNLTASSWLSKRTPQNSLSPWGTICRSFVGHRTGPQFCR